METTFVWEVLFALVSIFSVAIARTGGDDRRA